jgi:hypothetical protein
VLSCAGARIIDANLAALPAALSQHVRNNLNPCDGILPCEVCRAFRQVVNATKNIPVAAFIGGAGRML